MFDNTAHGDDDLFDDTDSDDTAAANATDTETDTDKKSSDEPAADEQKQDLNLEDKDDESKSQEKEKSSNGKEARRKQIEAWTAKIKSGKYTLDDLPTNLAWMRSDLEKTIGSAKHEVPKVPSDADIKAIVTEELSKQSFEKQFKDLVKVLNGLSLEKAKKELLESKFKSLRSRGLSRLDALETAMEIAGVDLEQETSEDLRQRMKLPMPGKKITSSQEIDIDSMDYSEAVKKIPAEKRIEHLRKLTEGARRS